MISKNKIKVTLFHEDLRGLGFCRRNLEKGYYPHYPIPPSLNKIILLELETAPPSLRDARGDQTVFSVQFLGVRG